MLGKGLESLIPPKKNGNGAGNGEDASVVAPGGVPGAASSGGVPAVPGGMGAGWSRTAPGSMPGSVSVSASGAVLPPDPEAFLPADPAPAPAALPPETATPPELLPRVEPEEEREPLIVERSTPRQEVREALHARPERDAAATNRPKPMHADDAAQDERVFHIEIDKVVPNPGQPRRYFDENGIRDLAHSIREFGFIQPLVVSKVDKETPGGVDVEYQLIAGERRLMAAKLLGLHSVPAIVRNVNLEREKLELAVIENIQREGLSPIETARAFQRLQEEFRMTQREIAAKLGKSREVVANTVRLLDLPDYAVVAVEKGELSESNARFVLAIEDPAAQKALFDDIILHKLTTRDVRERVQRSGGARRGRPPKSEEHLSPDLKAAEESLAMDLGTPVEIYQGANKGRITITFYSKEELENILRKLQGES